MQVNLIPPLGLACGLSAYGGQAGLGVLFFIKTDRFSRTGLPIKKSKCIWEMCLSLLDNLDANIENF